VGEGRPLVAAVIVNYRLPQLTVECYRDLRACGYAPLRALLIDNAATSESTAALEAALEGDDAVLAFADNLGYCAAVNRGIGWAESVGAEYVLLLNNDMRLPPGFLGPLVDLLACDPSVAAVAPTVLLPQGTVWCEGGSLAFAPNVARLVGHGGSPAPPAVGPRLRDYLPGACALYRLADLRATGGLDERYFMYGEDVDLGQRLRRAGRKVVWVPWTRVVHHASASSGGGRAPMRKFMTAANTARFLRAHGTAKLWLAFALFDLLGWPLAALTGTGFRAAWAKGKGAWKGLFGYRVSARDVGAGRVTAR
jgi:GT2 family glycosyltransferase